MTETPEASTDPIEEALDSLRSAEQADDEPRLELLEHVYDTLESELNRDRDRDKAGPPGR